MSASIIRSDLIRPDVSMRTEYNALGQPTLIEIPRVFMVGNIPQTTADAVVPLAIGTVQTSIPVGTPHPTVTVAKARRYQCLPGSHDTIPVVVTYVYSIDGYIDTEWTIESGTYVEQVLTDSQYDSHGNLVPIMVDNYYKNWSFNQAKPTDDPETPAQGTCSVFKPRKRLVMTKTIYDPTIADTLESASDDYIGTINSATFRGKAQYTWLCTDVDVIYEPLKGINLGRLEFIYRPEGWQEWCRFSNRELGVPPNIWKQDAHGFSNGMKQATTYLVNDFDALVALI